MADPPNPSSQYHLDPCDSEPGSLQTTGVSLFAISSEALSYNEAESVSNSRWLIYTRTLYRTYCDELFSLSKVCAKSITELMLKDTH